jgi:hypothetical protein
MLARLPQLGAARIRAMLARLPQLGAARSPSDASAQSDAAIGMLISQPAHIHALTAPHIYVCILCVVIGAAMGNCADGDQPARDEADAVQQYVAFAAGGQLEDIAAREIEWTFGLRCGDVQAVALPPLSDQWAPDIKERVFPGEAGVAKLRFALPRSADFAGWSRQRRLFASLKCTQGVIALVCVETGLPFDKEAAQAFLTDVIARAEGWDDALVAWWHHLGPGWRERTGSGHGTSSTWPVFPATPPSLSFRGSSIRDGQHQYSTPDMTPAVGSGTLARFPSWRVDLRHFDVEVLAVALQHELVVGLFFDLVLLNCYC